MGQQWVVSNSCQQWVESVCMKKKTDLFRLTILNTLTSQTIKAITSPMSLKTDILEKELLFGGLSYLVSVLGIHIFSMQIIDWFLIYTNVQLVSHLYQFHYTNVLFHVRYFSRSIDSQYMDGITICNNTMSISEILSRENIQCIYPQARCSDLNSNEYFKDAKEKCLKSCHQQSA